RGDTARDAAESPTRSTGSRPSRLRRRGRSTSSDDLPANRVRFERAAPAARAEVLLGRREAQALALRPADAREPPATREQAVEGVIVDDVVVGMVLLHRRLLMRGRCRCSARWRAT